MCVHVCVCVAQVCGVERSMLCSTACPPLPTFYSFLCFGRFLWGRGRDYTYCLLASIVAAARLPTDGVHLGDHELSGPAACDRPRALRYWGAAAFWKCAAGTG